MCTLAGMYCIFGTHYGVPDLDLKAKFNVLAHYCSELFNQEAEDPIQMARWS